jgi:hypothetical protein
MANAVNLPGEHLAGLIVDLLQKLKARVRTLDELALFLQGKNPFSLAGYFCTRDGLYVYESFTKRVLPFAKETDTAVIDNCDYVGLRRNMSDTDIINTYLGGMEEAKKNAFTLPQVRTYLDNQWNGEEEPLLTNGYANIFHVLGEGDVLFAVRVYRDCGRWNLRDWRLDEEHDWPVGVRIFLNKR